MFGVGFAILTLKLYIVVSKVVIFFHSLFGVLQSFIALQDVFLFSKNFNSSVRPDFNDRRTAVL